MAREPRPGPLPPPSRGPPGREPSHPSRPAVLAGPTARPAAPSWGALANPAFDRKRGAGWASGVGCAAPRAARPGPLLASVSRSSSGGRRWGGRQASAVCRGRGHAAGTVLGLPAPGPAWRASSWETSLLVDLIPGDQPGGPLPGAPAWRTSSRGTRLVGLLLEAHTARGPSLLCGPQVEPGPSLPTPHPSSLPSPRSDSARQPRVQAVGPERGSLDMSCPLGACPGLSVHGCPGGALGRGVGAGEARGLGSWDRKALLGGAGLRVRKEQPAGGWSERVPGEPPAGWGFSREPTLGGTIRLWRRVGGVRSQQGWARLGSPATHPSPRTQGQLLEPQTTPGTPQLLFAWGGVWAPAGGDQRGSAPF